MITISLPDLTNRPFQLTVEKKMRATSEDLYQAWTDQLDHWFAAPGTVLTKAEVNAPFFFEVHFEDQRHPHYGRFLRLEQDLVEFTWVTGPNGTKGAETVVTIQLTPSDSGTLLLLTHSGFVDEASRDQHQEAWPYVLEQLDQKMAP